MATVTFDVPDDIKEAFERTLVGENTSELIAGFMRGAVEKAQRRQRSREAIERILERRQHAPIISDDAFQKIREEGRP